MEVLGQAKVAQLEEVVRSSAQVRSGGASLSSSPSRCRSGKRRLWACSLEVLLPRARTLMQVGTKTAAKRRRARSDTESSSSSEEASEEEDEEEQQEEGRAAGPGRGEGEPGEAVAEDGEEGGAAFGEEQAEAAGGSPPHQPKDDDAAEVHPDDRASSW